MKPWKNVVHLLVLAGWVLVGVVFSLKSLSGAGGLLAGLLAAGTFWGWLLGLAVVTTLAVARLERPLAAVLVHLGALALLAALPAVFPLTLLRYGLDVLKGV